MFNQIKTTIKNIMIIINCFLKKIIIFIKSNGRKNNVSTLFLAILSTFLYVSTNFLCSSLPNNKINSVINVIENKILVDSNTNGIIYPKSVFSGLGRIVDYYNEDIKKMRSLYPEHIIFESYGPTPTYQLYPTKVDYLEKLSVNISFVLLPKQDAYYGNPNNFVYEIPFLAGAIDNNFGVNDIVINKKYADFLLYSSGFDTYDELISETIVLGSNGDNNLGRKYNIIAIMDDNSAMYQEIYSMVSDFFVLSDLFGMNTSSRVIFNFTPDNASDNRKYLDCLDQTFYYETEYSANGYFFNEHRVSIYELDKGEYNFYKETILNDVDKIYNYFAFKQNIFNLILFVVLDIFIISFIFFLFVRLFDKNTKYKRKSAIIVLSIVNIISYIFGILICSLIQYNFLSGTKVSLSFWGVPIICLLIFIAIETIEIWLLKKYKLVDYENSSNRL